jgi:hypothetical protein
MCGSGSLGGIEAQQAQTANTLKSDFNTVFAGNQNILDTITPALSGIITKGVGQAGYTPEEDAAQKSEIMATNQAATRQAADKAGSSLAATGDPTLPSGGRAAIMGSVAEQGAQTGAEELQGETAANYETGRKNFEFANQELPQAASTLDNASNGLGGLANQAQQGEASTENQRIQATRAWIAPVTDLLGDASKAATATKSFQNI